MMCGEAPGRGGTESSSTETPAWSQVALKYLKAEGNDRKQFNWLQSLSQSTVTELGVLG